MSCIECKFGRHIGGSLSCTRHPPVALSPRTAGVFPLVNDTYHCGEYKEFSPSGLNDVDQLIPDVDGNALGGEITCCVDCVFCWKERQPDGWVYECRRNPPLPKGYTDRVFPAVNATDWCGDIKVYVEG